MSDSDRQPDTEVIALAQALSAIKSQPSEAWGRMMEYLQSRLDSDARTRTGAVMVGNFDGDAGTYTGPAGSLTGQNQRNHSRDR